MLSISLVTLLPQAGLYLCSLGCFGLASFAESPRSVLLLSQVASEMKKCNFSLAFYFICKRGD